MKHPRSKNFNIKTIFNLWKFAGYDDYVNVDEAIIKCKELSNNSDNYFRVQNILNGNIVYQTDYKILKDKK